MRSLIPLGDYDMKDKRYEIGAKILFRGKIGYIIDIVNPNANSAYRYHVSSQGWLWSVADHEIYQPKRFRG